MKKSILFSIIAMIALASCQQKEDFTLPVEGELMTFYASIMDDATKTTADEENNQTKVLWAAGDSYAMSVKGGAFAEFTLQGEGGETTGTFTGEATPDEGNKNIAYYPYADGITIKDGKLNVVFPAKQAYTVGCIAAAPMVAVSADNTLKFQNVASLIKITIKGDKTIKSVSLTGNNDENLAGNAIVTYEGEGAPSLDLTNEATEKTITLDCGEGIALNDTEGVDFYFAVPSITLTKGFTVVATATDSEEKAMIKSTTKEVALTASKVKVFPAFTYEANTTPVSSAEALIKAINDAEEGETITLADDIESSEIITINKAITLDGNGKTLTSTAGRAINVDNSGDVTIKNLTIECSGERGINVIRKPVRLNIDNVTATAANYTLNVFVATSTSESYPVVNVTNSTFNGQNAVNVATAYAKVNISNSTINCIDDNTAEGETYAALCLGKESIGGKIIATETIINVTEHSDSQKARNNAEDGEVTIDGSTNDVTIMVAAITFEGSDNYYTFQTLEEAIEAAESGETIELIRNITASEIITINKAITLDGNGKTLTSTAGRAINVSGADGVTIQNLTIECTGERGINIIQSATNVTIDNVTATADNYTVNVASSAPNATVTITGSTLTGKNVVNVGAEGANVIVSNSILNCNDNDEGEFYAALCLGKESIGGQIIAYGTTINVTEGSDSEKARNNAEDGVVTIDGSTDDVTIMVAAITFEGSDYYYTFESLEEAITYINENPGGTIKLLRDYTLTEKITANTAITLDLNGKTLTENVPLDDESKFKIRFGSNITIQNGTISTTSKHPIVIGDADTYERIEVAFKDVDIVGTRPETITDDKNGTVILIGDADVSFDSNCSITANGYTCAIEGTSNDAMTSSANITINGASITLVNNSTYSHETVLGAGYGSTITVNSGTIIDGSKAANAVLTYPTGGTIKIAGGMVKGNLNEMEPNTGKTTAIEITGGTFTVDPSAYVEDGYEATKDEPNWVVSKL